MSLRRVELVVLIVAFSAGVALTPGTISADAGRLIVTFLGLVSASILPTITLLINSMAANGRSVQSVKRLETELHNAMDALFLMLGLVGITVAALVALAIEPAWFLKRIPHLTTQILPRGGQGFVVGPLGLVLWRIGQIPAILRRTLRVRSDIATEEAKANLKGSAPDSGAIRQAFATDPEFGKVVSLQDVQNQEKR